ncbi:MAG: hypothetical protein P8Y12_12520 [Gammaproteobacteria bacterium]
MKKLIYLFVFLPLVATAQDWQLVDDPQRLTELMSGSVIEATLKDGVKATAEYNSDGTGVLKAWGETFRRNWEVKGDEQVCIIEKQTTTCYRFESNPEDDQQYRIENLATGEKLVTIISKEGGGPITIESANKNSGGAAKPSAEEIAAKLANPNSPMASMTLKLQQRTFEGDLPNADDQDSTSLLFQPSFPFARENGDVILFRPTRRHRNSTARTVSATWHLTSPTPAQPSPVSSGQVASFHPFPSAVTVSATIFIPWALNS